MKQLIGVIAHKIGGISWN